MTQRGSQLLEDEKFIIVQPSLATVTLSQEDYDSGIGHQITSELIL